MRGRTCIILMLLSFSGWRTAYGAAPPAEARHDCEMIRERAWSQAALLFFPTVSAQGVRTPRLGDETGLAMYPEDEWQVRASGALSPLDMYRGGLVLASADAACRRVSSEDALEDLIEQGPDVGRLAPLKRQRAFLERRAGELQAQLGPHRTRFERGLSTLGEVRTLELQLGRLTRRVLDLEAEIARLEQLGVRPLNAPVADTIEQYRTAALDVETYESRVRKLAAWRLDLRGGVIRTGQLDWFATLEVSLNLGALTQALAESSYLDAAAARLETSHRLPSGAARRLRERVAIAQRTAEKKRDWVQSALERARSLRQRFDNTNNSAAALQRFHLDVEISELEGELLYLTELQGALGELR